jgi:ketosteroid isomerase-like protein
MQSAKVREFATDYTAAWCSQQASRVSAHFAEDGSLKINDGPASVGREAITHSAQGFMTAFPDMVVAMDSLIVSGDQAVYHWTLTGKNTGPNGTGASVRIHGYEEWTLNESGLIQKSLGHYDQAEYDRQLQQGAAAVAK